MSQLPEFPSVRREAQRGRDSGRSQPGSVRDDPPSAALARRPGTAAAGWTRSSGHTGRQSGGKTVRLHSGAPLWMIGSSDEVGQNLSGQTDLKMNTSCSSTAVIHDSYYFTGDN